MSAYSFPFQSTIFQAISTICVTGSLDGSKALHFCRLGSHCTISRKHWSALQAEDVYLEYNFLSEKRNEVVNIGSCSRGSLIFSTSSFFTSNFFSDPRKRHHFRDFSAAVLQITLSTTNANAKCLGRISFCNVFIIQQPP